MESETTAQDDGTKTDDALSSLAAALEAKDSTDDKGGSDEETNKGSESEVGEEETEEETEEAGKEEAGKKEEDAKDDEKTGEEEGEEESFSTADEVTELRKILREQKRELSLLKAKQSRVDKRTSKVIDEETGEEKDIEEELTPIETKIAAREQLAAERGGQLEIMLEQMSDTKKWSDVKDVVTEDRVEEIIDVIAEHITGKEGGELEENRLDVELSVWSIANPYKYMYDLIKQYHPDYNKEDSKTKTNVTEKSKKKEPAKTNASIGGLKGSGDKGGWTAAKIDAMDELDLKDVPRDVYNKYLRNELD